MALTEMSNIEPDIHKFNLSKNNQVTAACWIHHVFSKIIADLNFSEHWPAYDLDWGNKYCVTGRCHAFYLTSPLICSYRPDKQEPRNSQEFQPMAVR